MKKTRKEYPPELCQRCGRCCREKVEIDGVIFYTDRVCKYWDPQTKLCTVYEKRKELVPDCHDTAYAAEHGLLPADCPYVRDRPDYVGPVEYWEDPEVEAILQALPVDPNTKYYPRERIPR